MTRAKAEIPLAPRTRAYPDVEGCAAEFCCSPSTWLRLVEDGRVPPPVPEIEPPRWRWADVDAWVGDPRSRTEILQRYGRLSGPVAPSPAAANLDDPFMAAVERMPGATKKERRRGPSL